MIAPFDIGQAVRIRCLTECSQWGGQEGEVIAISQLRRTWPILFDIVFEGGPPVAFMANELEAA